MLLKVAEERFLTDIKPFTNIAHRCVFLVVQDKGHLKGFRIQDLPPSSFPSPGAGTDKTGHGFFPDQISFQLGKSTGNMKKNWPVGVMVSMASTMLFETDLAIFESVDQLDELPQATAQTIQPPDDQGVARPEIGKGFI
jgi:hypothetical protein